MAGNFNLWEIFVIFILVYVIFYFGFISRENCISRFQLIQRILIWIAQIMQILVCEIQVYEHLVTTAARDQQLVSTIRSKHFFLNIAGHPMNFCVVKFFFLICIFYFKILQETPRTSVSSLFFFNLPILFND